MAEPVSAPSVRVLDAVQALAFVGDLSMGQPTDHSTRVAWIASQLASLPEGEGTSRHDAACTALLRWSGCTANAPEFSDMLGDDVIGRQAMLSTASAAAATHFAAKLRPMAEIHCEVSGEIARLLGMPQRVELALRQIFGNYNGGEGPQVARGSQVPHEVFLVSSAGDLEIFSRVHGLSDGLRYIADRSDARYPARLVDAVRRHAADWLQALELGAPADLYEFASDAMLSASVPLELVADVIDLKLPWMTGYSRRVADAAAACAAAMGLPATQQDKIYRAALIHGIGRASVPNSVWDMPGALSEADRERLRLVPYWTDRAARHIAALRTEAQIASFVDERLDGSGYFRGAQGAVIDVAARVLAVAAHWTWLRTTRPGTLAMTEDEATIALLREGDGGRLDPAAIAALMGRGTRRASAPASPQVSAMLSTRELEVLRRVSLGASNKEAARELGISPSTVRTHLESVFHKLGCTTRAAATLKAMTLGLL